MSDQEVLDLIHSISDHYARAGPSDEADVNLFKIAVSLIASAPMMHSLLTALHENGDSMTREEILVSVRSALEMIHSRE